MFGNSGVRVLEVLESNSELFMVIVSLSMSVEELEVLLLEVVLSELGGGCLGEEVHSSDGREKGNGDDCFHL